MAFFIVSAGVVFAQLASEKRFTVYNGVISVEGQSGTNDILQIGNAGRDIASTGFIYIRPGTANGNYDDGGASPTAGGTYFRGVSAGVQDLVLTGSLCLSGVCNNTWPSGSGGGTLDQAYDFGGAGAGRTVTVDSGSIDLVGTGVKPLILRTTTNDQIDFYKNGNTAPHTIIDRSDVGFRFWDGTGAQTGTLLTILANTGGTVGGKIGVGLDNPASKFVINYNTSNVGGSDNALSVFANSTGTGSALYAEQANDNAYAGYFSGRLAVTGGGSFGTQKVSRLEMNAGQQYLSWEAENSLTTVVNGSCTNYNPSVAAPASLGGTAAYFSGCPANFMIKTANGISLPAGEWVLNVRMWNGFYFSAIDENLVTFGLVETGGRTLTSGDLIEAFSKNDYQTYQYRFHLDNTTTVTPFILINRGPSAIYVDAFSITPDNSSFSTAFDGITTFNGPINAKDAFESVPYYGIPFKATSSSGGSFTKVATATPVLSNNLLMPTNIKVYGQSSSFGVDSFYYLVINYSDGTSMTTRTWTTTTSNSLPLVADISVPVHGAFRGTVSSVELWTRSASSAPKIVITGYETNNYGLIASKPYLGRLASGTKSGLGWTTVTTISPLTVGNQMTLNEIVLYGNTNGSSTDYRLVYNFENGPSITSDVYTTTNTTSSLLEFARISLPFTDSFRSTLRSITVEGNLSSGDIQLELFGYEHPDTRD